MNTNFMTAADDFTGTALTYLLNFLKTAFSEKEVVWKIRS
jgi:hypothetical protein